MANGRGSAVTVTGYSGRPPGGAVVPIAIASGGHGWPPGAITAFGQVIRSTEWATLGELARAAFRAGLDP